MLNPESIRNASFSLMPTGYNPEQVDEALNLVAERLVAGEDISDLLGHTSFEVADVGYAQPEVDNFFAQLAEHGSDAADESTAPELEAELTADEEPADQPIEQHVEEIAAESASDDHLDGEDEDPILEAVAEESQDEPADVEEAPVDDAEIDPAEADEDLITEDDEAQQPDAAYVGAPREVAWSAPTAGELDLDVLTEAVDRTADTLGSLRGFIDNEIVAMKLAVERQAQETAKRCEQLLHEASAEAAALTESVNAEISRARKAAERQAEKERRELAKELKQARAECEEEVATARKDAEAYAAKVRAEADRDRAEAQRTIENAIGMQASIAESLERARQQLTPSQRDDIAA